MAITEEHTEEHTGKQRVPGRRRGGGAGDPVASSLRPLVETLLGAKPPLCLEFWDGSTLGPEDATERLRIASPDALRRIVWSPNDLGVARAYVSGDIDLEGDIFQAIEGLRDATPPDLRFGARGAIAAVRAARRVGAFGRPLPPPPEEARPSSRRHGGPHSKQTDARAISYHYDVGNEFYELVLGPAMTYSCARFSRPEMTLEQAQASKHELICRKLGLVPGMRLLNVGCGWGSMVMHAAQHHGVSAVGITISQEQAELARRRVDEAGLGDRVEIRLQDYRDVKGEQFDAISSIGMFEHVGVQLIEAYFTTLRSLLVPHGRLLNHAISSVQGSKLDRRSFMYRYVFPDGELIDVGEVALAMQRVGFELRDVESLREHYATTLRHWVANLESRWEQAVELVGAPRARVWRLYMAASAVGFDDGGINLHQVLGTAPDRSGHSAMPATRDGWSTD